MLLCSSFSADTLDARTFSSKSDVVLVLSPPSTLATSSAALTIFFSTKKK